MCCPHLYGLLSTCRNKTGAEQRLTHSNEKQTCAQHAFKLLKTYQRIRQEHSSAVQLTHSIEHMTLY